MTSFPDYDQYDGIGLAKLIKNGDISGLEICEGAIRRAEALNPKLNAIITTMYVADNQLKELNIFSACRL